MDAMVPRRLSPRIALVGAVLAAALGGASTVLAADHAVAISGFSFSPKSVTVTVGDTVTWTNSDAQSHTATADDGSWDTDNIANGTSKSITFSTAGTFAYHCSIHPAMTGTVVVEAAAGGGGGATTPPTDTDASSTTPDDGTGRLAGLLVMLGAGMVGLVVARRGFARQD
jgi:plastocyanin